jgi:hypothetical protein
MKKKQGRIERFAKWLVRRYLPGYSVYKTRKRAKKVWGGNV